MKRASRRNWLAGPRAGGPGLHGRRVEGLRLALALTGQVPFSPQQAVNVELVVTTGTRLFN